MSEVSIRGWDCMRAEQGSLLCHIFSSGCLNEVVSCRTGRGEVRLSAASLWYLEADHESCTQTKAFCASSWFSVEWRFVCQLRTEVAYESNVTYFTNVKCKWILVLCWGFYKESKRKWLIKQHTKEFKKEENKKKKETIRMKEIINPTENESWGGNKDPHQKQGYLWSQFNNI